jgi:ABC-type lipoprotein export system ATPase subunit
MNRDLHVTIIIVTHDPLVGSETERIFHIKDGKLEGIKENIRIDGD